jgi:hypothetical protein
MAVLGSAGLSLPLAQTLGLINVCSESFATEPFSPSADKKKRVA